MDAEHRLPRALGLSAIIALLAGCGGPKQVCECAVHVGGTTPATAEDEAARGEALNRCLEVHGGGTISGCTMPASVQEAPLDEADDEADYEEPWPTLARTPSGAVPSRDDLSGTWWETTEASPPGPREQIAPCHGPVAGHWSFEQRGVRVQAEHRATTDYRSGIRGRMFIPAYTFVTGTREGATLVYLTGTTRPGYMSYGPDDGSQLVRTEVPDEERVELELTHDEESGHLVGTKNGAPVRFVPFRVVPRTEPCPPAPRRPPPA